jgi:general secretion pathway protein C
MTARLLAFVIWAAVAATVVFWGLRLFVSSPSAPLHAVAAGSATMPRGDVTRLLGGASAPAATAVAATSNRFRLVGVVAPRSDGSATGVALIAVDDKPARAYRIGASVDESWVVQAVQVRSASLGPRGGATALRLELPPVPVAATGTLAPPLALQAPPPVAPPPVVPAPQPVPPIAAPQPSVPMQPQVLPAPLQVPPQAPQMQASPALPAQPEPLQLPPRRTPQPVQ